MDSPRVHLADLVDMNSPRQVYAEVKGILALIAPDHDLSRLDRAFHDTVDLYEGAYPGYRRCTTQYHDLRHTTDVVLALARLIHGAIAAGERFAAADIALALTAAMFHDAGYIQTVGDDMGSGGKYTLTHVERSIGFVEAYFARNGYAESEFSDCRDIIRCTSLAEKIGDIGFASPAIAQLGKMTATADFIGQMADRTYLEKLLFLFREFSEGHVMGFASEQDLLRKTFGFYQFARERMETELGGMNRHLRLHFGARWQLEGDLYMDAIEQNMAYLAFLMEHHEEDYREKLKRGGIAERLAEEEGEGGEVSGG